jgi:hypothetical protein
MPLLFAFSLQEEVEKYGPYVGLAAFLGLAVLTVLYFAQARELKRLRDWAGRAPERAQEIEARAVAQAEELRRAPAEAPADRSGTVGPAQPIPRPASAAADPSGNGRGTGTPAPIPIGPRPAVAVAAAAARAQAGTVAAEDAPEEEQAEQAEVAETSAPVAEAPPTEVHAPPAEDEDEAAAPAAAVPEAPAPAGNGAASPPPEIPRATPRPQAQPEPRPEPAPAAPLRASTPSRSVPPRRPATASPRRDNGDSSRAARITVITLVGVVALVGLVFGATQIFGGGDGEAEAPPNVAQEPTTSPGGSGTGGGGVASVADQRPDTVVAVLNGTATDGLAGTIREKLVAEGYSDDTGMVRTGNNSDQQRQDSVVLYAPGKRRLARDVAKILGINVPPEELDADTLALANNTGENPGGQETDVVVVAGADQAS